MPRRNERKDLDREGVDVARGAAESRPAAVGVRRLAQPGRPGMQGTAQIDPSSYQCRRLAAQLADQWVEMAAGRSRSVIAVHRQALDNFLKYVDKLHDSDVSLDHDPAVVMAVFDAWAKDLIALYDENSIMPYRMSNIVQTQMAGAVVDGVITDEVLAAYARGPAVVPKPRAQPLDEFSKDELKRMVLAARAHIRAARKIREWATKTIRAYESGKLTHADQRCLGHMLQMATRGERIAIQQPWDAHPESLRDLFPDEAWSLYQATGLNETKNSVALSCYRATLARPIDLVPYRVLLMAGTGVAVEEISALTVSDIEWLEDGVRVQMTKSRARRSKGRYFPGSAERGGWDVPALLQSLLDFTEPVRAIAGAQFQDCLWLSFKTKRQSHSESGCAPAPADFGTANLASWIDSVKTVHDMGDISTPHDMRRIRKTKVAQRAIDLRGAMADIAGDDHTSRVFFQHYGQTTSLKVYSGSVISGFQTSLAEAVKTGFTAFLDRRAAVPASILTEALPIEPAQAHSLRSGAHDMGVVDCQNPFNSPFTKQGKLCGSAPLSCLMCENAVVFTDHLPNIVALIQAMDNAKRSLAPDDWIATWGRQYAAAQALMSSVPERARAAAARKAAAAVTDLPAWLGPGNQ
ncbi:Uncharacterised protein [Mycobacteroides abscessus]|nr:hypothetical protein MM1S1530915_4946 [Mycobacteroides abscessus subsp. bolletii 1S-153-0915]MBE5479826.1 hypothetical protein [Mycobacteroides abscessus]SKD22465.1 Uncharacterised protein [Mycobacteroides abscessus subsp. massiliense]QOF31527.1 hypothetical protein E3G57_000407 [Mycobacteroides abscessus]CPR35357.1 Uncharacterised protein [Mycobacteroides abscessus]